MGSREAFANSVKRAGRKVTVTRPSSNLTGDVYMVTPVEIRDETLIGEANQMDLQATFSYEDFYHEGLTEPMDGDRITDGDDTYAIDLVKKMTGYGGVILGWRCLIRG